VTEPLLIVEDLVGGYVPGVDILKGVNLTLQQGELVGIIGPNGAGKSTLVKAIFGLVAIRSGKVWLKGTDITGLPTHELVSRGMGYVPQRANVFASLSVEDNLRMGLFLNPGAWAERFEAITTMFPLLQQRRRQKAGLLSGGERQMVAFGRALMTAPSVLLLDEPSAGLSPIVQDVVFHKVKEIATSGVSVVMVEQNARHCLDIADRGYVLDQGRNAYTGTGQELLHDPKVIDLYLGTLARQASSG
jgi:branched-chain amino acid transport system ATP-binding protein